MPHEHSLKLLQPKAALPFACGRARRVDGAASVDQVDRCARVAAVMAAKKRLAAGSAYRAQEFVPGFVRQITQRQNFYPDYLHLPF